MFPAKKWPKDGNSPWNSSAWMYKNTWSDLWGQGNCSCDCVFSNSVFLPLMFLVIFRWSLINSPIISDRLKNLPGPLLVPTISLPLILQVLLIPLQRQADQLKKVLKLRNGGRCQLRRLFCCGQKNSVRCKFHPRVLNNTLYVIFTAFL